MDEEDSIFRSDPERLKRLVDLGLDADDPNPRANQDLTTASFGDLGLTPGSRIGQFKIERELGRGGAGIVYLAHDTKLDRKVAIKSLPPDLIEDEKVRSRFKREARALASVNHPNIATIFEVLEEDNHRHYLVLEYIPGKTLAQRIAGGPLKLKEAFKIGVQVAEAIAAAHEKGVIHRDLKPGNIKFTADGQVKVLDFGLAKAVEGKVLDEHSTLTLPGRIVGTPAYMSPEQASGQAVDRRTDIWAFGCCLFEMLTSHRPFRGETMTDLMAAVLSGDPDWSMLANDTPQEVVTVLHRCLERQPAHRFQSTMDLAFVLKNMSSATPSSTIRAGNIQGGLRSRFREWTPWVLTGAAVIIALFAIMHSRRHSGVSSPAMNATPRKIELHLPDSVELGSWDAEITAMAIAPDGRKFVYVNAEGLWLRWLDRLSPAVLLVPGKGARGPFWSPKSTEVAYLLGQNLFRLAIAGGQPKLVCRLEGRLGPTSAGGSWFPGDQIIFALGSSDLYQVSAHGGEATLALARSEDEMGLQYANPLPGGRGVLFVVYDEAGAGTIHVWTPEGERKLILDIPETSIGNPIYSPSGHVIYERWGEGTGIWAFPFSLTRLERTGSPMLVSEQGMDPSVAEDGTLLLNLTTEELRQLVWVDRTGQISQAIGRPQRGQVSPRLSMDGKYIATSVNQNRNWNIWITEVERSVSIPAVRTHELEIDPYWFRVGRKIAFRRWTRGMPRVFVKPLDGSGGEEELCEGFIRHLSPSGKYLMLSGGPGSELGMGYVSLEASDRTPIPFPKVLQDVNPRGVRLSPDDRLLAFRSSETGQNEVYVADFPLCTNMKPVSRGAGNAYEWHPDGSELFYLSADSRSLWSVEIDPNDPLSPGEPNKVFYLPDDISRLGFQVAADGQRFLMLRNIPEPMGPGGLPKAKALLMENWYEDFRQRQ